MISKSKWVTQVSDIQPLINFTSAINHNRAQVMRLKRLGFKCQSVHKQLWTNDNLFAL